MPDATWLDLRKPHRFQEFFQGLIAYLKTRLLRAQWPDPSSIAPVASSMTGANGSRNISSTFGPAAGRNFLVERFGKGGLKTAAGLLEEMGVQISEPDGRKPKTVS